MADLFQGFTQDDTLQPDPTPVAVTPAPVVQPTPIVAPTTGIVRGVARRRADDPVPTPTVAPSPAPSTLDTINNALGTVFNPWQDASAWRQSAPSVSQGNSSPQNGAQLGTQDTGKVPSIPGLDPTPKALAIPGLATPDATSPELSPHTPASKIPGLASTGTDALQPSDRPPLDAPQSQPPLLNAQSGPQGSTAAGGLLPGSGTSQSLASPNPTSPLQPDKPYDVDDQGNLSLHAGHTADGLLAAHQAGLIESGKLKDLLPKALDADKAFSDQQALQARVGADDYAKAKAFATGAGRGAAFLAGAIPAGEAGAGIGATIGAFGGPLDPITIPVGGALGGAIGALGGGYAAQKIASGIGGELAKHNATIQSFADAATAHPGYDAAGNLITFAVPGAIGLSNLARTVGIRGTAVAAGDLAFSTALKTTLGEVGSQALAGAAFEGVARPTFDYVLNQGKAALGITPQAEQVQSPTAKSVVENAILGVALGNLGTKFKGYDTNAIVELYQRGQVAASQNGGVVPPGTFSNVESDALKVALSKVADATSRKGGPIGDPADFQFKVNQAIQGGQTRAISADAGGPMAGPAAPGIPNLPGPVGVPSTEASLVPSSSQQSPTATPPESVQAGDRTAPSGTAPTLPNATASEASIAPNQEASVSRNLVPSPNPATLSPELQRLTLARDTAQAAVDHPSLSDGVKAVAQKDVDSLNAQIQKLQQPSDSSTPQEDLIAMRDSKLAALQKRNLPESVRTQLQASVDDFNAQIEASGKDVPAQTGTPQTTPGETPAGTPGSEVSEVSPTPPVSDTSLGEQGVVPSASDSASEALSQSVATGDALPPSSRTKIQGSSVAPDVTRQNVQESFHERSTSTPSDNEQVTTQRAQAEGTSTDQTEAPTDSTLGRSEGNDVETRPPAIPGLEPASGERTLARSGELDAQRSTEANGGRGAGNVPSAVTNETNAEPTNAKEQTGPSESPSPQEEAASSGRGGAGGTNSEVPVPQRSKLSGQRIRSGISHDDARRAVEEAHAPFSDVAPLEERQLSIPEKRVSVPRQTEEREIPNDSGSGTKTIPPDSDNAAAAREYIGTERAEGRTPTARVLAQKFHIPPVTSSRLLDDQKQAEWEAQQRAAGAGILYDEGTHTIQHDPVAMADTMRSFAARGLDGPAYVKSAVQEEVFHHLSTLASEEEGGVGKSRAAIADAMTPEMIKETVATYGEPQIPEFFKNNPEVSAQFRRKFLAEEYVRMRAQRLAGTPLTESHYKDTSAIEKVLEAPQPEAVEKHLAAMQSLSSEATKVQPDQSPSTPSSESLSPKGPSGLPASLDEPSSVSAHGKRSLSVPETPSNSSPSSPPATTESQPIARSPYDISPASEEAQRIYREISGGRSSVAVAQRIGGWLNAGKTPREAAQLAHEFFSQPIDWEKERQEFAKVSERRKNTPPSAPAFTPFKRPSNAEIAKQAQLTKALEKAVGKNPGARKMAEQARAKLTALQNAKNAPLQPGEKPRSFKLPEGPHGVSDALDHIKAEGRIIANDGSPEFDGAPKLAGIYNHSVYGGTMKPDDMATQLHENYGVGDGSVGEMWNAVTQAIDARKKDRARQQEQDTAETQASRFSKDTGTKKKGEKTVHVGNLNVGDVLTVHGEKLKVTDVDPDTLDITLEDHSRYGVQQVDADATLFVEKVKPAPKVADSFGEAEKEVAAPEDRPSPGSNQGSTARPESSKQNEVASPSFALESPTGKQLDAEKAKAAQKAKIEELRTRKLSAKELDTTGDMLDPEKADNPLFANPKGADTSTAIPPSSRAQVAEKGEDYKEVQAGNATVAGPATFKLAAANPIQALHASPHKVDKFSTDFIGSGEGNQVYGWGLYFAESEAVSGPGGAYHQQFRRHVMSGADARATAARLLHDAKLKPEQAVKELQRRADGSNDPEFKARMAEAIGHIESGNADAFTYKVHLDADPSELLDWDKPFESQSPKAKAAISAVFKEMGLPLTTDGEPIYLARNPDGQTIHATIAASKGARKASEALLKNGLLGIRYADQGSRVDAKVLPMSGGRWAAQDSAQSKFLGDFDTKEQAQAEVDKYTAAANSTSNYVLFDDSRIKITHRNGEPVSKEEVQSAQQINDAVMNLGQKLRTNRPTNYDRTQSTKPSSETEVDSTHGRSNAAIPSEGASESSDEPRRFTPEHAEEAVVQAIGTAVDRIGDDGVDISSSTDDPDSSGFWIKGDGTIQYNPIALARSMQAVAKAGGDPSEWLASALEEEMWHGRDFRASRPSFQSLHRAFAGMISKNSLRELYRTYGAELPPAEAAAEYVRMLAQRFFGTPLTESHYRDTSKMEAILDRDQPRSIGAHLEKMIAQIGGDETRRLFAANPLSHADDPVDEPTTWAKASDALSHLMSRDGAIGSALDDIAKVFVPAARGEHAKLTAEALQEVAAIMARNQVLQTAVLKGMRTMVARMPEKDQRSLLFDLDENKAPSNPDLAKAFERFRKLDTERVENMKETLKGYGINDLKDFHRYADTIIPHLFKDPDKAEGVFSAMEKKMSGKTDFLKPRSDYTYRELAKLGLEPKSSNFVDLVSARWWMQERFLGALKLADEMEKAGSGHWETSDYTPKAEEREIGHRILSKTGQVDGKPRRQKFYAKEQAADIVTNYLSDGLRGKAWFQAYSQVANTLNNTQLGLSFFHGGFISSESITSQTANAIKMAADGDWKGAAKAALQAPISPILDYKLGKQLVGEWNKPGSQGEAIANMLRQIISGGGRGNMDSIYNEKATEKFMDALHSKAYSSAVLRAPFAAIELLARPITEKYVPYLKAAAAAKMIQAELARHPNASPIQQRSIAAEAVRSTNNRFGQMVYDNLHLHKVTKDILMGMTRSLGWNWGTFAEIGGGVKDFLKAGIDLTPKIRKGGGGKGGEPPEGPDGPSGSEEEDPLFSLGGFNVFKGKKPIFTQKMGYVLALPLVAGIMGAVINAAFGQKAHELKDYYFPKTGDKDAKGRDIRLSLPTYMKDVFAFVDSPTTTITNKLHPLLSMIGQMFSNKDFYGTEIRHQDDPYIKQALQELKFVGKNLLPFTITNLAKTSEEGASPAVKALGFVGFGKAAARIGETNAEKLADQLVIDRMPQGTRTQAEADKGQLKAKILNAARNKDLGPLRAAVTQGTITSKEASNIVRRSQLTPLQDRVHSLDLVDAQRVFAVANADEKKELAPVVNAKIAAAQKAQQPTRQVAVNKPPVFAGF